MRSNFHSELDSGLILKLKKLFKSMQMSVPLSCLF